MQFFIGIVPPKDYKQRVIDFQKQWKGHTITTVVEPHITLKAQGGLTKEKKWLSKVGNISNTFKPFQITLDEPSFFGEDVLYLSMKSAELNELHKKIVKAIDPSPQLIVKYFEMDYFVPHMTLAKTSYGVSREELKQMEQAAKIELSPYPTFEVPFIRVYQEAERNTYVKLVDLPLVSS